MIIALEEKSIWVLNSALSVAMNFDNFSFMFRNKRVIKECTRRMPFASCMLPIFSGKWFAIVLDDTDKTFCCRYKKVGEQTNKVWKMNTGMQFSVLCKDRTQDHISK